MTKVQIKKWLTTNKYGHYKVYDQNDQNDQIRKQTQILRNKIIHLIIKISLMKKSLKILKKC